MARLLRKGGLAMAKIGCAGILVKDTFCGPVRALPRPGELVAIDAIRTRAGGCAANVAIDLRKQDLTVDLVGCIGRDVAGETLVKELQAAQINCDHVVYITEHPTSETVILLVEREDRRYLHAFGANQAFTIGQIDRDWLAELDLFYLGGLFAMPGIETDELLTLLALCREKKVITVVDVVLPTNFKRAAEMEELLPYIDWFLPNDAEAAVLTGETDPLKAICVFRNWGAGGLVVTLGGRGSIGFRQDECWRCSAYPWQTVDPSGAGDAFASGLITGITKAWDFPRTLVYASALGASATLAVGTTESVLTNVQAEQLVTEQPLTVGREYLPSKATHENAPKTG
jgi:sugar/nucleoside kinase (ribokinase family)